jgi:hypothetical protein
MLLLAFMALMLLTACSPRHLLVQGLADELATQGQAQEEDLQLAREAGAFYLKLSESLLREAPDHARLAEAVASGFTQYSYAFVAFEADRLEARDVQAAQKLRERAARLYRRAHGHAMAALERQSPGFARALARPDASAWPRLRADQLGLAYWAAASWGAYISLSKDDPEIVADLPLAVRLASLAHQLQPDHGAGALASLMGTFEAARPGGSMKQALVYFDQAIAYSGSRSAAALLAKAEGWALPSHDRAAFESLLRQAIAASTDARDVAQAVMRERALWLLGSADDLF